MPDPAPRPHAVFDFDGVLVRRDSTAELIGRRLRRRPWLLPLTAVPLAAYAATAVVPPLQAPASRVVVRAALAGTTSARTAAAGRLLGAELAADDRVRVDGAVARMREHLADGDVTVVSAGLAPTVRAFLDALDLHDVALVASGLGAVLGGTVLTDHTYGRAKVARAAAAGLHAWDHAYTDAASDFPLLEPAAHRVLVNPRPSVVTAARRRWPDVEVVRW